MKFKQGDVITLEDKSTSNYGKRGSVVRQQGDLVTITLAGETYERTYWDTCLAKVEPPQVGDLVRVIGYGKYQAQEGHVTKISGDVRPYSVDIGDDIPDFDAIELEVIERLPEKIVREEGMEIDRKHVRKGDLISATRTYEDKGVKVVEITEGIFHHRNDYDTLFTEDYGVITNAHFDSQTTIILLKKSDEVLNKLTELSVGALVSWKAGDRLALAGKLESNNWSYMCYGASGSSHGGFETDQISRFITRESDGKFEILKDGNE